MILPFAADDAGMSFRAIWSALVDELDALPEDTTLRTPLSHNRFRIAEVQEHRVIINHLDRETDETRPLQRDQFETLYRRITDEPDGFELDRLPPDAGPNPAVLSAHPRIEVDEERGIIIETDAETTSQVLDSADDTDADATERTEPAWMSTRMRYFSLTRLNATRLKYKRTCLPGGLHSRYSLISSTTPLLRSGG
jgi:hypothetical protein